VLPDHTNVALGTLVGQWWVHVAGHVQPRTQGSAGVLLPVQSLQQLQQQLAESTSKLREYAAADGLIERAITTAASAGGVGTSKSTASARAARAPALIAHQV
jgi:hypothetical protein